MTIEIKYEWSQPGSILVRHPDKLTWTEIKALATHYGVIARNNRTPVALSRRSFHFVAKDTSIFAYNKLSKDVEPFEFHKKDYGKTWTYNFVLHAGVGYVPKLVHPKKSTYDPDTGFESQVED